MQRLTEEQLAGSSMFMTAHSGNEHKSSEASSPNSLPRSQQSSFAKQNRACKNERAKSANSAALKVVASPYDLSHGFILSEIAAEQACGTAMPANLSVYSGSSESLSRERSPKK